MAKTAEEKAADKAARDAKKAADKAAEITAPASEPAAEPASERATPAPEPAKPAKGEVVVTGAYRARTTARPSAAPGMQTSLGRRTRRGGSIDPVPRSAAV